MTKMQFYCYWKTRFHYIVIADLFFLTFWCQLLFSQTTNEIGKEKEKKNDDSNGWEASYAVCLPESIKKSYFMFHVLCKMS